jgi:hypothetical protein
MIIPANLLVFEFFIYENDFPVRAKRRPRYIAAWRLTDDNSVEPIFYGDVDPRNCFIYKHKRYYGLAEPTVGMTFEEISEIMLDEYRESI